MRLSKRLKKNYLKLLPNLLLKAESTQQVNRVEYFLFSITFDYLYARSASSWISTQVLRYSAINTFSYTAAYIALCDTGKNHIWYRQKSYVIQRKRRCMENGDFLSTLSTFCFIHSPYVNSGYSPSEYFVSTWVLQAPPHFSCIPE